MYGAGDGRREEGTSPGGLKWPLLAALWYGEKSPARWCRILIISLLILWWPRSKMSLTGNKLAEACARRPDEGPGGVKSPSGDWSSNSCLLIFPKIMLSASRCVWQGEGRTLADPGGHLQKAWERCKTSSSTVVELQNYFPIIPEREQQHLPTSLGWGAPSHVQHLWYHSFIFTSHFHSDFFFFHCIARAKLFPKQKDLLRWQCINKWGLSLASEKNMKLHFGQGTHLFIFLRAFPFNTENTPELLKSSRYIGNAEVSNLIAALKRH